MSSMVENLRALFERLRVRLTRQSIEMRENI
jgi:hypothetical protein